MKTTLYSLLAIAALGVAGTTPAYAAVEAASCVACRSSGSTCARPHQVAGVERVVRFLSLHPWRSWPLAPDWSAPRCAGAA
jgi:hypothetical protein